MTNIANSELVFHSTQFDIVEKGGRPLLLSTQLAQALGYANDDSVSRIYRRNADEFTAGMTETVKLTVSGNLMKEVRAFSLRGAHLVAMFSKAKIAKEFRKWVLDVLDQEVASALSYSNKDERTPLKDAVNMLIGKSTNLSYSDAWRMVHQRFAISSVKELTVEQLPAAVEYVHKIILEGKLMDDMPQFSTPAISTIDPMGMEDLPAGRYLVARRGDKTIVQRLEQHAIVPLEHVNAFRRDMNQYMQYSTELLSRMRILHGETNLERLAEPLIR